MKTIIQLLKFAYKANKKYFIIASISVVGLSFTPIISAFAFSEFLNKLVSDKQWSKELIFLIFIYILFIFLEIILERIKESVIQIYYRYDMTRFFLDLGIKKIGELDLEIFENSKYADIRNAAMESYEWRPADLLRDIFQVIYNLIRTILALGALFLGYPLISILILLSVLPRILLNSKSENALWSLWVADTKTRREYGILIDHNQNLNKIKDVKLLGISNYLREKLNSLVLSVHTRQKKVIGKDLRNNIITSIFPNIITLLSLIYLTNQFFNGEIEIGGVTFTISIMYQFREGAAVLLFSIVQASSQAKYVSKFFEFMEIKNKVVEKKDSIKELKDDFSIEFKNVSFKYPDTQKYIFKNFNLYIKPREKLAIVGENGVGKSTLVKLLLRLYDVSEGNILLDGIDIKEYSIENLRKKFSVLLQDFTTFDNLTITENIGIGNLEKFKKDSMKTTDEIIDSSNKAKASEFILSTPRQFNEVIGRDFDGSDFSGGQHQRLALARMIYRGGSVVIMDEPTSAVDAKAEAEIFEELMKYLKEKTVLLISHRFSTVRVADRIIVLNNGEILEDGNHEELLKKNGMYSLMFNLQARGYK